MLIANIVVTSVLCVAAFALADFGLADGPETADSRAKNLTAAITLAMVVALFLGCQCFCQLVA